MSDTMTTENSSALGQFVEERFQQWKGQRQKLLEPKWTGNYNAYKRVLANADALEDWQSKLVVGVCRQKVQAAYSLIKNGILAGDRLPYEITADDKPLDGQQADAEAMRLSATEIQTLMDGQFTESRSIDAVGAGLLPLCVYGEGYLKWSLIPVTREAFNRGQQEAAGEAMAMGYEVTSEDVPGVEHIPLHEIYRDLEARSVEDGIGVFRVRSVSAADLRRMSAGGDGGYWIEDAIERVIANLQRDSGTQSEAEQSNPALVSLRNYAKKITLREYWGTIPADQAERFTAEVLGVCQCGSEAEGEAHEYDGDGDTCPMCGKAKTAPYVGYADRSEDSGHEVEVYHDPTISYGGQLVGGLRVRPPRPVQPRARPVQPRPAPRQELPDDDVPFY
jgi:hypothetical protein